MGWPETKNEVKTRNEQSTAQANQTNLALLNPLLPFLSINIPRHAQPSLMPGNQRSNNLVLAHPANSLVITLRSPRSRVEFGPINLEIKSVLPFIAPLPFRKLT